MNVIFNASVPLDLHPFETPVVEIVGKAELFDDCGSEIEVASMSLYSVDYVSIINTNKRDPFIVMDSISNSLMETYSIFYDDWGLKEKFTNDDPSVCQNILLLDTILVKKEFRGFGVGRAMFDRAMRLFGKTHGIVVTHPSPLQLASKKMDDFSDLASDKNTAFKKIQSVYRDWGFKSARVGGYYYQDVYDWMENNPIPLDMTINPTIEEKRLEKYQLRTGQLETV